MPAEWTDVVALGEALQSVSAEATDCARAALVAQGKDVSDFTDPRYQADVARQMGGPEAVKALLELLASDRMARWEFIYHAGTVRRYLDDPEQRAEAMAALWSAWMVWCNTPIHKRYAADPDPSIRSAALRCLARNDQTGAAVEAIEPFPPLLGMAERAQAKAAGTLPGGHGFVLAAVAFATDDTLARWLEGLP